MPRAPSPVAELLAALSECFSSLGVRWYLFGAQAAIFHGVARLTADVDVTVKLEAHSTQELVVALARRGFALRVSDTDDFVARTRVLPAVHTSTRIPVDVVLAGPGLEEMFLERADTQLVEGVQIPIASAEDLVTMKILAGRPKDLDDVAGLLKAHQGGLDVEQIRATLGLLEEALSQSDLLPLFHRLLESVKPR